MATIVMLTDQFYGSAWYRGHVPGKALLARGHEVVLAQEPDAALMERCDVLVTLHAARPSVLQAIRYVNARGGVTVFETDDDYWTLHPENPAASAWTTDKLRMLETVARECALATVSTPELADVVRPMNRDVRVLRNMLPDEFWPTSRKATTREGGLVLGWAGSISHAADMRIALPVMKQLLGEYPDLRVRLAGAKPDWTNPHPRLEILPWVQIEAYSSVVATFDIGVAPLQDTRFNRCKSDLKFVEYGMIGLPVVASQVDSYKMSIIPGENGFMARNAKDWIKHLRRLIEDADLREKLGANARAFAESRLISRNVELWERAYGLTD